MGNVNTILTKFALDPENPEINYELAYAYFGIGQTAAAISYFLRCAERTEEKELAYECLIRIAQCFDKQGNRHNTVRGLYKQAMVLLPERPEAYFLSSQFNEKNNWQIETYMNAHTGLTFAKFDLPPLRKDVGYPGKYGLLFEKAISSWWWGKGEETRNLWSYLVLNHWEEMPKSYQDIAFSHYTRLGLTNQSQAALKYTKNKYDDLRMPFAGSETINENFAQVYQDMFVLSMLNGKRNGTFFEVGGGEPYYGNNTALLEERFGWKGVSIEIDKGKADAYTNARKNTKVMCEDATRVNYLKTLQLNFDSNVIDYLQLDVEPAKHTFEVLLSIPFDEYKFAVITYEHDHYLDHLNAAYREKSRKYLSLLGYELVVNDISPDGVSTFEDWWVHPDLVDRDIIDLMKDVSDKNKHAEKYMLSKKKLTRTYNTADFDWGSNDPDYARLYEEENFNQRVYESFYKIKEGDVILDLGANAGSFTYSVLSRNIKKAVCVEPSNTLFPTLVKNLQGSNCALVNRAISFVDSESQSKEEVQHEVYITSQDIEKYKTITFKSLVQQNNLQQIDFIKFDCEGGEFFVFTEENYDYIRNNVKHIAGEWHFVTHKLGHDSFIKFRDIYLKNAVRYNLFDRRTGADISSHIFDDEFIKIYSDPNQVGEMGQLLVFASFEPVES